MSIAAKIVSALYSPHSSLAFLDHSTGRDGLKAPEIAAAVGVSESAVYEAESGLVRAGLICVDKGEWFRPVHMMLRQLNA